MTMKMIFCQKIPEVLNIGEAKRTNNEENQQNTQKHKKAQMMESRVTFFRNQHNAYVAHAIQSNIMEFECGMSEQTYVPKRPCLHDVYDHGLIF